MSNIFKAIYLAILSATLILSPALWALGSKPPKNPVASTELPPDSYCHQLQSFADQQVFELAGDRVDQLVVDKGRRLLHLLDEGDLIRSYPIALGKNPQGHKQVQGDEKTPEGNYLIEYKNPNSKYHLSLAIDYPHPEDETYAREQGLSPGGDIMIHGLPNKWWRRMFVNHPEKNWTDGCIAVNNQEMDEIWALVESGAQIEICPLK